jgi:hypothetical protein
MENEERFIICNQIITPDGTRLISHSHHDFQQYTDANGQYYAVDGGNSYTRRLFDKPDYKDETIYSDDSFEVIRQHLYRGARGINGDEPLHFIKLCDMETSHVEACIKYNEEHKVGSKFTPFYQQELEYRKENDNKS